MFDHYLTPSQDEIARYWQLAHAQVRHALALPLKASPAATVPMIRLAESGALELVAARWGLIPLWWKEQKPPADAFIAPSEEALSRPIWKIPASKWRCLVPAIGWYISRPVERLDPVTGETTTVEQPCLVRLPDRQPFAFAGLMSRRTAEGNQTGYSVTILTREATGPAAQIHARVPIVLPKDAHAAWLYRELTDAAVAIEFAREQAVTEVVFHAVDARADNAPNRGAELNLTLSPAVLYPVGKASDSDTATSTADSSVFSSAHASKSSSGRLRIDASPEAAIP
jgi:putative SOS response-associated peptidase YedK